MYLKWKKKVVLEKICTVLGGRKNWEGREKKLIDMHNKKRFYEVKMLNVLSEL